MRASSSANLARFVGVFGEELSTRGDRWGLPDCSSISLNSARQFDALTWSSVTARSLHSNCTTFAIGFFTNKSYTQLSQDSIGDRKDCSLQGNQTLKCDTMQVVSIEAPYHEIWEPTLCSTGTNGEIAKSSVLTFCSDHCLCPPDITLQVHFEAFRHLFSLLGSLSSALYGFNF